MVHGRWRIAIRMEFLIVFFYSIVKAAQYRKYIRKYHGLEKDQYQENKTQVGDGTRHSHDQQKIKNQNNQNRQQDEPDGSCLLEVFAEGFPVGTEDIRLLIFDHLQRDVVHCCEIGADCHNRDTHNKENNVQHHQVEDTAHNLRELTVQAEKTHNLFLFSVELSVPPINVPAGRHHRKV